MLESKRGVCWVKDYLNWHIFEVTAFLGVGLLELEALLRICRGYIVESSGGAFGLHVWVGVFIHNSKAVSWLSLAWTAVSFHSILLGTWWLRSSAGWIFKPAYA